MLIGTALTTIAVLASSSRRGKLNSRGGAVVVIGLFPIVFGSDKHSVKTLLLLAIVLVSFLAVFFILQLFV